MGAYVVDGLLSIVKFETLGVKMYPNPTNTTLTLNLVDFDHASISISHINGTNILYIDLNSNSTIINILDFLTGKYFVKISTILGMTIQKLI